MRVTLIVVSRSRPERTVPNGNGGSPHRGIVVGADLSNVEAPNGGAATTVEEATRVGTREKVSPSEPVPSSELCEQECRSCAAATAPSLVISECRESWAGSCWHPLAGSSTKATANNRKSGPRHPRRVRSELVRLLTATDVTVLSRAFTIRVATSAQRPASVRPTAAVPTAAHHRPCLVRR